MDSSKRKSAFIAIVLLLAATLSLRLFPHHAAPLNLIMPKNLCEVGSLRAKALFPSFTDDLTLGNFQLKPKAFLVPCSEQANKNPSIVFIVRASTKYFPGETPREDFLRMTQQAPSEVSDGGKITISYDGHFYPPDFKPEVPVLLFNSLGTDENAAYQKVELTVNDGDDKGLWFNFYATTLLHQHVLQIQAITRNDKLEPIKDLARELIQHN